MPGFKVLGLMVESPVNREWLGVDCPDQSLWVALKFHCNRITWRASAVHIIDQGISES